MRILLTILLLLIPFYSWADTHTAASCSRTDVNTAITAAASGDTVNIPACTATSWDTRIDIVNKTLIINGAGQGVTNLATAGANAMFYVYNTSSYGITIKNMTINGNAGGVTDGLIQIRGGTTSAVIQNITFTNLKGRAVAFFNQSFGVISGCTFTIASAAITAQAVAHFGYGAVNATAWTQDDDFGTNKFLYIEGCTFNWNHNESAIDFYGGARIVIRFNTVYDTNTGGHGLDSGGYFSPRAFEIYNNSYLNNTSPRFVDAIGFRGGTGYVYNNTMGGTYTFQYGIGVLNYRTSAGYNLWQQCNGTNWKACSGAWMHACATDADCAGSALPTTGGVSHPDLGTCTHYWNEGRTAKAAQDATYAYYFDLNTDETGYPCVNQVGRGKNNTLMPLYEYNNTLDGNDVDITSFSTHIQADRDYYNDTQKPDYTAYTCPHPLADPSAQGACASGTAGTAGYTLTGGESDTTAPTVLSVYVNGATMTINFSEAITSADNAAFTLDPSGADVTVDCPAVATGAKSMACTISRALVQSETAKYAYTDTKVIDAAENPLANIGTTDITGNLTPAEAPTSKLTVNKTGSGCTITSSPSGISFGGATASDDFDFNTNTAVTLSGWSENGWNAITYGGDCAANGTVTMNADKECTATCTQVQLFP